MIKGHVSFPGDWQVQQKVLDFFRMSPTLSGEDSEFVSWDAAGKRKWAKLEFELRDTIDVRQHLPQLASEVVRHVYMARIMIVRPMTVLIHDTKRVMLELKLPKLKEDQ